MFERAVATNLEPAGAMFLGCLARRDWGQIGKKRRLSCDYGKGSRGGQTKE